MKKLKLFPPEHSSDCGDPGFVLEEGVQHTSYVLHLLCNRLFGVVLDRLRENYFAVFHELKEDLCERVWPDQARGLGTIIGGNAVRTVIGRKTRLECHERFQQLIPKRRIVHCET